MDFSHKISGHHRISTVWLIYSIFLLFSPFLRGEETETVPSEPPQASQTSQTVKPVLPQIHGTPLDVYLLDIQGKLSPAFINYPFEAFDTLNLLREQKNDAPEYQIQSIDAAGKIVGDLAEITVRFRVEAQNRPLVRVRLGMQDGIIFPDRTKPEELDLNKHAQYEGSGRFRLIREQETGAYVALLRNTSREEKTSAETGMSSEQVLAGAENAGLLTHTITLKLSFPVNKIGTDEFRLRAGFPYAFSSILKLEVPIPDAVVMVSQGTSPVQTIAIDEKNTQFSIQGLHRDFDIRWRAAQKSKKRERKPVLQVEDLEIQADMTAKEVRFDVTIPVQSTGIPFDTFHVLLPENANWIEETFQDYTIREMSPLPYAGHSRQLEVTLPSRRTEKVEIHLKAVTSSPEDNLDWLELGGFQVVEAEKQFGKLNVTVPREYRLNYGDVKGLKQMESALSSDAEGNVTRFEIFRQPCSLKAKATRRYTQLNVRPEFQVQIDKNQAILKGRLSYTIHGSPVDKLYLDPAGWQMINFPNNSLIDNDRTALLPGQTPAEATLLLPLRIPAEKTIDFDIQARQSIDPKNPVIRLEFPKPKADWIEPVTVAVYPANNIELNVSPEVSPIIGMSRKPRKTVTSIEPPIRLQEPLFYQIDDPESAVFCAEMIPHTQEIHVQVRGEFRLTPETESLTYYLNYDVKYEPVERLTFEIPKELEDKYQWLFTMDSHSLTPSGTSESLSEDNIVLKRVTLPEARIGKFTVTVQQIDNSPDVSIREYLQPGETHPKKFFLLLPQDGKLIQETVNVSLPRGMQINLIENETQTSWKKIPDETVSPVALKGYTFQTEAREFFLNAGLFFDDHDSLGSTIIEKTWLQTWLIGSQRRDRVSYLVVSDQNQLSITLPQQTRRDRILVKLDGQQIPVNVVENKINVPFSPGRTKKNPLLVEMWYEADVAETGNPIELDMPQFAPEVWVRPMYWQMIFPSHRHMISVDRNWIPQYQWQFDRYHFSRVPLLDQQGLEEWIGHGITPSEPLSVAANCYLLSTLRPLPDCEIRIVDRSTLVLFSSGITLFVGLVFLYFKKIRYAGILFTLLVLFMAVFAYQPVLILLFLQAGSVGVVLSLLAMILYRFFVPKESWAGIPAADLTAQAVYSQDTPPSRGFPNQLVKKITMDQEMFPPTPQESSNIPTNPDEEELP
ncbi:MAG: hypothetical protein LBQ54_15165 [Planctomycetaceae bacterium]|jgi:hypothetical protein|nr:hypothetical protein [Planctomycetaceae bacterium]